MPNRSEGRLGKIQKEVFEWLAEGADLSFAFLTSAGSSRALYRNLRQAHEKPRKEQIRRSVKGLERQRLVKIKEIGAETQVLLTEFGKQRLLRFKLDGMKLASKPRWDGNWHIVIFDIPESLSSARRALSQKIQDVGALALQKSVFIYPFSWKDEVDFMSEIFRVAPYIRYIEATAVEGEEELIRKFNL